MATFKNVFLSVSCILFVQLFPAAAQQRGCPTPDFISAQAHVLIDSYRDLIDQNGTTNCVYTSGIQYRCVTSGMPAYGYNLGYYHDSDGQKVYGTVTFVSSYFFDHYDAPSRAYFRTMWADKSIYPALVCPEAIPEVVQYPFAYNNTQNHTFQAIMVPVSSYQSFPDPNKRLALGYPALTALAIKPEEIKAINDIYLECPSGYIRRTESQNYADVQSSKGIVCELLLKNGQTVQCYVINNYDGGGTLLWKKHRQTTLANTAPATLVKKLTDETIVIAPNPVKDILTIQNAAHKTVQITNLVGQVVLKQEKLGSDTLDVRTLATGSYLVTILDANNVVAQQKILKQD
jgi:hypothetical protein